MFTKLTNGGKVLDAKSKSLIFGGADTKDCSKQCLKDCGDTEIVRKNQNGDEDGKAIGSEV